MSSNLATYIHDHLAGAQFAIELLRDLRSKAADDRVSGLAAELLPEVESDRSILNTFSKTLGEEPSGAKESAAWLTQKLSRVKLSATDDLGAFEAIETLSLGILGKLALWNALGTIDACEAVADLDLEDLAAKARSQHARVEQLRCDLARAVLSTAR